MIYAHLCDALFKLWVTHLFQLGLTTSYYLWSVSATFGMFVLARMVGGISKGNLSVSMAAMTDISSTDKRASGMVRNFYRHFYIPELPVYIIR